MVYTTAILISFSANRYNCSVNWPDEERVVSESSKSLNLQPVSAVTQQGGQQCSGQCLVPVVWLFGADASYGGGAGPAKPSINNVVMFKILKNKQNSKNMFNNILNLVFLEDDD